MDAKATLFIFMIDLRLMANKTEIKYVNKLLSSPCGRGQHAV